MAKLGERRKNLDVVIHDINEDGGVEERKEEEVNEPPPKVEIKKEEEDEEKVEKKKRKLSDKQKESLRIGREKNLALKKEKKNQGEVEKLRLLIQEEMEKRNKKDEEQESINTQVDVKILILAVGYFFLAFTNFNKDTYSFLTDDVGANASAIAAFPSF